MADQQQSPQTVTDWQGNPVDLTPKAFTPPPVEAPIPQPDQGGDPVPFQVHRQTPAADAVDPMYTHDRDRIWHDPTMTSADRVRVVLGDLHSASWAIGDPLTIRAFLSEIGGIEPRAEWFSSDAVADAARSFASAWRDVGAPILVEGLDADADAVMVAARSYADDDQAAADAYTKLLNQELAENAGQPGSQPS